MQKLPAPVEEDLSKGILESIDMDSYRVEKKAVIHVQLADEEGLRSSCSLGLASSQRK